MGVGGAWDVRQQLGVWRRKTRTWWPSLRDTGEYACAFAAATDVGKQSKACCCWNTGTCRWLIRGCILLTRGTGQVSASTRAWKASPTSSGATTGTTQPTSSTTEARWNFRSSWPRWPRLAARSTDIMTVIPWRPTTAVHSLSSRGPRWENNHVVGGCRRTGRRRVWEAERVTLHATARIHRESKTY